MIFTHYRFLAVCCLLLSGHWARAQFTLTDAYFPEVGDSLLTDQAPDDALDGIEFQLPGENLSWDFGAPATRFSFTEVIEAVVNDTLFPRATSRTTSAAFNFEYYQRTPTAFNLVGLVGHLPFFRDLPLSIALEPARPLRRVGITYGDHFETTSVRRTALSTDSLPAEVRDSDLGQTLLSFDSIEIRSTSVRTDRVDAYGTLRLNGFDYQVLREKRVEQMETRLYLKQIGGEYFDVTDLTLQVDPSYGQYLGKQPSEGTYFFWAREIKEPIVEIEFDENEQPKTLLFRRGGQGDITATHEPVIVGLGVAPNPITGAFELDFDLLHPAAVVLELLDAAGHKVKQWQLGALGQGPNYFRGSLVGVVPGVYYLTLRSRDGVATQKIIRP